MSPRISAPKIDSRKANDLLRFLRQKAPHYTKEWPAKDDDDPGVALLKIFSFIGEGVISRLNRAPDRNFLAFLDMLGVRLLPARPARAPVRFLVANGTEFPFLVARGTQVSAPPTEQHPVDLPFETIQNLLVVPAVLTSLIAVDPEKDRIYRSPPGFLELKLAATRLPPLRVAAFSAANSKFLQLDPPDQVKKDDFLRIDREVNKSTGPAQCVPAIDQSQVGESEHLVVAEVKGSIVTLTEPLAQDHIEGTLVQKVTQFELFESKNWQEHTVYLGHSDYFAIKSEAQIVFRAEQVPGGGSNFQPFNVVWEFFGVTETNKEEGWHAFQITLDGTGGFSRDGQVVLIKPAGEIKEKEINGSTSRWIRARLDEPLPAVPPRPLPRIEAITLGVSSGGKDLPADQAFNNDTPLTTDVQFFPFGTEPRIFDRFSIASEEAFSKPGAQVKLDFTLDATDLLAAPSGLVNNNKMRIFAHAAPGRLIDFQIDPRTSSSPIKKHGAPPDTRITAGSIPAVVSNTAGDRIGIFVKADDGKIYLRFLLGDVEAGWQWIDLQAPTGELQFNPAAIFANSLWQVFVVAGNQLFSKSIDPLFPNIIPATWTAHSGGPQIDSMPWLVDLGNRAAAFVTDVDGRTWMFDAGWTDLTPLDIVTGNPDEAFLGAKNARPCALPNAALTQFRVFLRSKSNYLVVIDTAATADSFGPPPNSLVDSNPTASVTASETRLYVRSSDNRLWSIEDSILGTWTPHLSPSDFNLAGDPFALVYQSGQGDFISVFSTSDKNSLLEFRVRGDDVNHGTLQAGPLNIIVLQNALPPGGTYYINITAGPGKSASGDTVRAFDSALTRNEFGVLDLLAPLEDSPTTDTTYDLLREEDSGHHAVSAGNNSLELEAGAVAAIPILDGDYVFVNGQLRQIPAAPVLGDVVTLDRPWTTQPAVGAAYLVLRLDPATHNNKAAARSARRAVLDPLASTVNDEYQNLYIEITAGPGQSPIARRIADYIGAARTVVLDQDFPTPPDNTSGYKISVSSVSQGWFIYEDPDQTELRPELSWEYWNGRGFVALAVDDKTDNFLIGGPVTFTLPDDIEKTEVAGQENYWIRARIVGGDYGRELFSVDPVTNKIKIEKDPIHPPLVKKLGISYSVTDLKPPQFCLTFNNQNYLDQTAANVTPDKYFYPYLPRSRDRRPWQAGRIPGISRTVSW